jgi:RNA polymerase sigma-70 factor (ECF subfamily)
MNFWEIHDQYHQRVRRFILTLVKDEWVADDLIQETFLRIQKNLGNVRDPSKLSSWIFRIAYNLCQDHFRRSKTLPPTEKLGQDERPDYAETSIQKELEQHQMGQCVQDQMSLLPESLRSIIVLFDVMGFNHSEVADILGITTKNAKVRLHRARKKLKATLEEECTFEVDERNVLVCDPADK